MRTRALRIVGKQLLIRNGSSAPNQRARRLCLDAFEEALAAIDPSDSVRANLKIREERLIVGHFSIPLSGIIRVIAVGKASYSMFTAATEILKNRVASGILVAPKDAKVPKLSWQFKIFHAGHPFPDQEGIRASEQIISSIERMRKDELLLCLISGGASAMLPAPVDGIALEDKRKLTKQLIESRASIHEINTIRRHLSELKGGRLVERCSAGTIISLIISDVSGNVLADIASGLTAPDPTKFRDAVNVLKKLNLWGVAPQSVKLHLVQGLRGRIPETPKPGNLIFKRTYNSIIADNRTACEAAKKALQKRRIRSAILTSSLNMEAQSLGSLLASIAVESARFHRPLRGSDALILGGETTVEVRGSGKGGRNQETALSAVERIAGLQGIVVAALGTDGIDGNSPAAGAMVDGRSKMRASQLGLNVGSFLKRNDSYAFFRKLGDNIVTGRTGTNVGDLYMILRVNQHDQAWIELEL
jgi:glycerate 2-kinase